MKAKTPQQELIEVIALSGLSRRQFALAVLVRDERTVRRWCAGHPMPTVVRRWLVARLAGEIVNKGRVATRADQTRASSELKTEEEDMKPWERKAAEIRAQKERAALGDNGLKETNAQVAERAAFADVGFVDASMPGHFIVAATKTRGGIALVGQPPAIAIPIPQLIHFVGMQLMYLYDPTRRTAAQVALEETNRGETEEKSGG